MAGRRRKHAAASAVNLLTELIREEQTFQRKMKQQAVELEQQFIYKKKLKEYDAYLNNQGTYDEQGVFQPIAPAIPADEYAGLPLHSAKDPATGATYKSPSGGEDNPLLNREIAAAARHIYQYDDSVKSYEEAMQKAARAHGYNIPGAITPEPQGGGGMLQNMQDKLGAITGMSKGDPAGAIPGGVLPGLAAGAGGPMLKRGIDMALPQMQKAMQGTMQRTSQPSGGGDMPNLPDPAAFAEGDAFKDDATGRIWEVSNGRWVEIFE